jgi:hypothetical protein
MRNPIRDGGPAFPQFELVAGDRDGHGDVLEAYTTAVGGMSLRDYFAAKALQVIHHPGGHYGEAGLKMVAEQSYRLADAMIAARQVVA